MFGDKKHLSPFIHDRLGGDHLQKKRLFWCGLLGINDDQRGIIQPKKTIHGSTARTKCAIAINNRP